MASTTSTAKSMLNQVMGYLWIGLGSFLAALSIRMFLYPHHLIDGGVVGISMILGRLTNDALISVYIVLVNLPNRESKAFVCYDTHNFTSVEAAPITNDQAAANSQNRTA